MSSSRLRTLILGGLLAALAVWYGLSHWLPAESRAADEDEVAELEAAFDDLDLSGGESGPATASAERGAGSAALAATGWPANPFFPVSGISGADPAEEAQPAPASSHGFPQYTLTGIIAGDCPLAIIDGEVMEVGAQLADGVTVVKIDGLSVTLREATRTCVLKLPE